MRLSAFKIAILHGHLSLSFVRFPRMYMFEIAEHVLPNGIQKYLRSRFTFPARGVTSRYIAGAQYIDNTLKGLSQTLWEIPGSPQKASWQADHTLALRAVTVTVRYVLDACFMSQYW